MSFWNHSQTLNTGVTIQASPKGPDNIANLNLLGFTTVSYCAEGKKEISKCKLIYPKCRDITLPQTWPWTECFCAILISVQFSCSFVSDSLRPHELQYARPPCPSPTPRVYPNPCPLSWWCHPTISSFVVPFPSCPQSFPATESFQMSQLFTSGGQSIGGSASTSVLPMNTQDWSPFGWTGWISLQSKGLSRVFSNTTV